MGCSYSFASRETSRRILQVVINQEGLDLMLALGFSTHPKDARDLTYTIRPNFFPLKGGFPHFSYLKLKSLISTSSLA
jgi:hypothetical protein